jgi:hypothetical protein
MRAVLSLLLLVPGAYVDAAGPAPSFDVRSTLNSARELAGQNLLPAVRGADQSVYEYRLEAYPKDRGECPESAKRLADSFAAASGAETLGAVCLEDTSRGYTIAVQYRAEKKLRSVSTSGHPPIFPDAGWTSREACRGALGEETRRFERNTGLKSAAAYCFQNMFADADEWAMRIDAFGSADKAPHLGGAYVFGKVLGHSKQSFLAAIGDGMRRKGFDVSFVRYRASLAYGEIGVLYYASDRVRLKSVEYAKLASAEQCAEQLGLARAALPAAGEIISYCGAQSVSGNYEVSYMFAGEARATTPHYKRYDSYEACMAERGPELEHFRGQGRSVVGALCGRTGKDWRITFLNGK